MKKIITLLLFCGAYCSLMAQSEAETKAQINKIKAVAVLSFCRGYHAY